MGLGFRANPSVESKHIRGVRMSMDIIERLFSSFSELETAIESAKQTLLKKENVPEEVFERLGSYDGILAKQRSFAVALREHIESGNWDEVSRHVSIINGLSGLIRDDARSILSSLALNSDVSADDETKHFC
jgi:hypothetical protein